MKRALITFLAVVSLSVSVAGSVATVTDAKSNNDNNCSERGGTNNSNHDKRKCDKKCDDDRGKSSTPKACHDDDKGEHGHGHGDDD